jgi:hypothetical protein
MICGLLAGLGGGGGGGGGGFLGDCGDGQCAMLEQFLCPQDC